jgi:hypothetical protein
MMIAVGGDYGTYLTESGKTLSNFLREGSRRVKKKLSTIVSDNGHSGSYLESEKALWGSGHPDVLSKLL